MTESSGFMDMLQELMDEFMSSEEFAKRLDEEHDALVLSDARQKMCHSIANKRTPLNNMDMMLLSHAMKEDNGTDLPREDADDTMLEEYADNLYNYLYTYKESATEIDPSIDPNEFHRGPMAQDIEKVAPDCVKKTSDGTLVVDGNRLALVNAGVIGDLARRVLELEGQANGK